MHAIRYVGRSAAQAALGLMVLGLGMEAYQLMQMYRGNRARRGLRAVQAKCATSYSLHQ